MATGDDANNMEVGVEWVNEYHGTMDDLWASDDSAEWFYNILGEDLGWTRVFDRGNGDAWEMDFETPTVGGRDYDYADNVDFAFFCGHGYFDGFYFGTPHDGDGYNPYHLDYTEAKWGDKDLEWIAIDACLVLYEGGVYQTWGPVFNGLHAMFGFATIARQYARGWPIHFQEWGTGQRFAEYLRDKKDIWSIGDCWVNATYDIQENDVYGAALAVNDPTRLEFYDCLPGHGWIGQDIPSPLEQNRLYYFKWQC